MSFPEQLRKLLDEAALIPWRYDGYNIRTPNYLVAEAVSHDEAHLIVLLANNAEALADLVVAVDWYVRDAGIDKMDGRTESENALLAALARLEQENK